jgi:molybdate transport system regulatory protein
VTRLTLRIDFDKDHQLGPGKIRLLELIGEHGSISAASRLMNMSYRRAWGLVEALNATFAQPLVAARTGGSGGGKAELTEQGRDVVRCYRAIEARAMEAGATELRTLLGSLAPPPPAHEVVTPTKSAD